LIRAIERARAALTPVEQQSSQEAPAPVAPRPSAADGLLHLAAGYMEAGEGAAQEGTAPDAHVVIHLEKDLGAPEGALAASLDDGTHVSAETLRRVACDGGLVAAVVDERARVLDVGRRTRAIPTAIKVRLNMLVTNPDIYFAFSERHRRFRRHHIAHSAACAGNSRHEPCRLDNEDVAGQRTEDHLCCIADCDAPECRARDSAHDDDSRTQRTSRARNRFKRRPFHEMSAPARNIRCAERALEGLARLRFRRGANFRDDA